LKKLTDQSDRVTYDLAWVILIDFYLFPNWMRAKLNIQKRGLIFTLPTVSDWIILFPPLQKNRPTPNKKSSVRRFIAASEGFQLPKIVITHPGDHYGTRCHS
jgi:hypothetical protein